MATDRRLAQVVDREFMNGTTNEQGSPMKHEPLDNDLCRRTEG